MRIYKTKFNRFGTRIASFFSNNFLGPWKLRSIGIFSLLLGFYIGSTLTSYLIVILKQRIVIVLLLLILIELSVRVRNNLLIKNKFLITRSIDNFRIGITYAVVLEAFKLGS